MSRDFLLGQISKWSFLMLGVEMVNILTLESREIVEELRHLEEKLHMWREVCRSILKIVC